MGIWFCCLALLALAQQQGGPDAPAADVPNLATQGVAIDGTVLDARSGVPILGARVILRYQTSEAALQEVPTDVNGAFHFSIDQPGQYAVEASKDGYAAASKTLPADLTKATPLMLELGNTVAVRGRVIDGETEKGLAGFTVSALRATYFHGNRELLLDQTTFTDSQGDFRLGQLLPGDYFLEIKKFPPGTILSGRQAGKPTGPGTPSRYPQTIWPGDAFDDADARPFTVSLGDTDIGNVALTKTKPGRVQGKVTGLDCARGYGYDLSIEQRFGARVIEERDAEVPCGSTFSIPDLSPGNYRVVARPNGGALEFASADLRIERGSDLGVNLRFRERPRVVASVTLDCKDDCGNPAEIQSLLIQPVAQPHSNDPTLFGSSLRVDEAGTFQGLMPLSGPVRLSFKPLPDHLFIKRVIYNGVEVGTTFMPDETASVATLQVILSDRPSELSGIVQQNGEPVPNEHVALAPWPLVANDGWSAARLAQADSKGRFSFAGLASGTYRVVGLSPEDWNRRDRPDVLTGLLSAGEDVSLGDGESKFIVVK